MSIERELGRLAEAVEGLRADVRDLAEDFRGHAREDEGRFAVIELRHATDSGRRSVYDGVRGWGDRMLMALAGSGATVAATALLHRFL